MRPRNDRGFTLLELLVAMALTIIVMASVYTLLGGGQKSFDRENEVTAMQMSTRSGLDRISRDLTMAGYRTPPASAILWNDGGGNVPDEITIIYADPDVAISLPMQCGGAGGGQGGGGGPCGTIGQSSTLLIDPLTLDPAPPNPADAYQQGMVLAAVETSDCNGDGMIGIIPFTVTTQPVVSGAGGTATLNVNHNPGSLSGDINPPGGFNGQVQEDCAVVGRFRMVSYRVNPLPPTDSPNLERRDLTEGQNWTPVAFNIENLQFRYGVGAVPAVADVPALPTDDPATWITQVDVSLTGRTERTNLQGASAGTFDPADTFVRKAFSSRVGLRNVASEVANRTNFPEEDPAQAQP